MQRSHRLARVRSRASPLGDETLSCWVFGNQPGTYTCDGAVGEGGGVSIHEELPDGGYDPSLIVYGGTVYTQQCTITLESYSPMKGGHVTGKFIADVP